MKHSLILLAVSFSLVMALPACDNNDEPGFKHGVGYRLYNKADSAAFCEIMKTAYSPFLDYVCDQYDLKLDSVPSWSGEFVQWKWHDDIKQYRLYIISMPSPMAMPLNYNKGEYPDYGTVSPYIWEMDSLKIMSFHGKHFNGAFPSSNGKGKNVTFVRISNTDISSVPLDLFTLPNLHHLDIFHNYNLTRLPDGLDTIPIDTKEESTLYHLMNNGFIGKCPININRKMWLDGNNFNSIDWEEFKKIDIPSKIKWTSKSNRIANGIYPFLYDNKIQGEIPEEIRGDTLSIIYLYTCVQGQRKGYGVKGLPSEEEMNKMRDEYIINHPEYKPYLDL